MPELHIEDWKIASKEQKADPGHITIDLDARDVTTPIDDEAVNLSEEPQFPRDRARDREPTADERLHQYLSSLPFGPIRALDPTKLHTKWHLMEQLTPTIPLNEYNMPMYYYRADLLDVTTIQQTLLASHPAGTFPNQTPPETSEDLNGGVSTTTAIRVSPETRLAGLEGIQASLDAATVHLDYHEGFPALPNARPFWEQLPDEPRDAYDAFVFYLELGSTRKRSDLIAYPPDDLTEWFHQYYWNIRAKAFELYRVVDANKRRLSRMLDTEDKHFAMAERLMQKLEVIFKGTDFDDKLKEMSPSELFAAFDKVAKIQRISTGLNANGGSIDPLDQKRTPNTQVIVQQIVETSPETIQKTEEMPDLLVESPDAIDLAQELIIRTQNRSNAL